MRITVNSSSSGCLHFGMEVAILDSPMRKSGWQRVVTDETRFNQT